MKHRAHFLLNSEAICTLLQLPSGTKVVGPDLFAIHVEHEDLKAIPDGCCSPLITPIYHKWSETGYSGEPLDERLDFYCWGQTEAEVDAAHEWLDNGKVIEATSKVPA